MNLVSVMVRCPPLAVLPMAAMVELTRVVEVLKLSAGDALFQPGDPADSFYLVHEGTVALVDAQRQPLGNITAGQHIGESAVVLPSTHRIGAIARGPSLVIALRRAAVEQLWERQPPVAALLEVAFTRWIMQDLRKANDELLQLCDEPLDNLTHQGLRQVLSGITPAKG